MIHLARHQRRLAGGLRRRADLSQKTCSSAVGRRLQLDGDAVRVAKVDLGRPLLGAAGVFAAHADACAQRPARQAARRALLRGRYAESRERLHDAVDLEPLDGQADVIDPGLGGGPLAECDELRTGAETHDGNRALRRDDRQAEQPLVELQRALGVRDRQRHVVHRQRRQGLGRWLCAEDCPQAQHPRQRVEDVSAADSYRHMARIIRSTGATSPREAYWGLPRPRPPPGGPPRPAGFSAVDGGTRPCMRR